MRGKEMKRNGWARPGLENQVIQQDNPFSLSSLCLENISRPVPGWGGVVPGQSVSSWVLGI